MRLITDLHIHSHYSRATSKNLSLEEIYKWGKIKGIQVIGTGDFTHPGWFAELSSKLKVDELNGLYELDPQIAQQIDQTIPQSCRNSQMWFIPTVEISNIYKRHDKVRRLHNVVIAPDLETVAKINLKLSKIGNLSADGRPILGLDSEDLLKIVLEISERCLFIPAHIWTPWFAMFGSKSGFDSLEEAFGDSKKHIYAVETGLSADPEMCRRLSQLEGVNLVSNSDAHSTAKLGREATILDCNLTYESITSAIKSGDHGLVGTVEFYPEEGMYHADGHRDCKFWCLPEESKSLNGLCPKCYKPLVIGVLNRVQELADQTAKRSKSFNNKSVKYIVPLPEVLTEISQVKSVSSKKVIELYGQVTAKLGSDFEILLNKPIVDIAAAGFVDLSVAIDKIRKGEVFTSPGYDGTYGTVKLFEDVGQTKRKNGQLGLF